MTIQPVKQSKTTAQDEQSGYAPVNGLNLYHEIHGSGAPLLLAHAAHRRRCRQPPPREAAAFFALLGGGEHAGSWDRSGVTIHQLAILPGATHYDIFFSPALAATVTPFFDAPLPEVA